jgi:ATPases involved in chromosome partitioning
MKIATFLAEKGGVGKTTILYNFAEWLSTPEDVELLPGVYGAGKKVLMIDLDQQASLTETYNKMTFDGSSANMLRNQPVNIVAIRENIDLIPGSFALEQAADEAALKPGRELLLYWYFNDFNNQYDWEQYDYILIDAHPDFKLVNQNIAAIANIIVSPLEPSKFGVSAKAKIEARLGMFKEQPSMRNPTTRESLVTAELVFFNNMIKHNEAASHRLLEATDDDETVIATIDHRSMFPKSVEQQFPISEMVLDTAIRNKFRKFFEKTFGEFTFIKQAIDLVE